MKKITVMMLVLILCIFPLFSSCDKDDDKLKEQGSVFDDAEFIKSKKMDFKGSKFTIFQFAGEYTPKPDSIRDKMYKQIAQRNNISEIVFENTTDYMNFSTQIATKVLGGTPPNIILCGNMFYITGVRKNVFADITSCADKLINDSVLYCQKFSSSAIDDGKYYGVGSINTRGVEGIFYNPKMIEDAGLTPPVELYRNNEWTFDVFLDYCRKLTKDTNGDGEIDQWGFASSGAFASGGADLGNFITANGAPLIRYDNTSKKYLENMVDDPKAHNALNFITKLYSEPIAANPRMNFEKAAQLFEEGKVAMISKALYYSPKDRVMIGFPKGPDATDETFHTVKFGEAIRAVGAGIKNPEECLRIWEQIELLVAGLDQVINEDLSYDPDLLAELTQQLKDPKAQNNIWLTDKAMQISGGGSTMPDNYVEIARKLISQSRSYMLSGEDNYRLKAADIITDARYNNMAPAAATAMRSPAMQEEIDRLYNGAK